MGPIVTWDNIDEMCNHFEGVAELNNGIDNYLTTNLSALAISRYNDFNETFTDMQQRAEVAVHEREQNKRAKKEKTKENKMAKAKKMLDDLTALIDESFRSFATKRVENRRFKDAGARISDTPSIHLETPFINSLLKPYIITPSKMKKKTMKELAETINMKLRMIASKNLLAMNYLSDSNPFEKGVKQFLRETLPNLGIV